MIRAKLRLALDRQKCDAVGGKTCGQTPPDEVKTEKVVGKSPDEIVFFSSTLAKLSGGPRKINLNLNKKMDDMKILLTSSSGRKDAFSFA
ncbi:hypothetical protein RUM44_006321 [Polyplax serrata]|uniref:Uncharacterized protein n=1 Tax=Polyplax serrata TaxID=468196 RepID=A0ABR1AHS8_POLSC